MISLFKKDKKTFLLLLITCLLFISTIVSLFSLISNSKNSKNNVQVYSFSGKSEDLEMENGILLISPDKESIIVNLTPLNKKFLSNENNLTNYQTTFDYNSSKNNIGKMDVSNSIFQSTSTLTFSRNLSSSTAPSSLTQGDIDDIENSFNFSLRGTYSNGAAFKFTLPLTVKKEYPYTDNISIPE